MAEDACTTIMVSNTRWRPELEHNYTLVDSLCPIGPTYRHEGFYIWKESETRWSIGTNVCNAKGDIRTADHAAYPHLVIAKWNVRDEDGDWHYSTETRVVCVATTLPGAGRLIVPVVTSVCAFLVILILVIVVVCVVIKRRRLKPKPQPRSPSVRRTLIDTTISNPIPITPADDGLATYSEIGQAQTGSVGDKTARQSDVPTPDVVYAQVNKTKTSTGCDDGEVELFENDTYQGL